MTKTELNSCLKAGHVLEDLLPLTDGQECLIYKATKFSEGEDIIYIPDVFLNEIPYDRACVSADEIREVIGMCYTGNDFLELCHGHGKSATELFVYCDWQHPSSALCEIPEIDEESGEWREDYGY